MPRFEDSNITVLLGSGISIPSDYPSTKEITQRLFSEDWLGELDKQRWGEGHARAASYSPDYGIQTHATTALIRVLRSYIDQHMALHGRGEATYEDIYYLARQLRDGLLGEYDNPALLPLMFDLRSKNELLLGNLNKLYSIFGSLGKSVKPSLEDLLEKCLRHIEESTAGQLKNRGKMEGLGLLNEVLSQSSGTPLPIVTLNHDTLIEAYFAKTKIRDGFLPVSETAAEFRPESFEGQDEHQIELLKLHGSIDWFRYKTGSGKDLAVKILSPDRFHVRDGSGQDLGTPNGRLLLAGTTNKELDYGSGVFLELMYRFHARLNRTNLLIVSGYGFSDKGINNRIWAWLDARPENRLLILHAHMDELRLNAKPSFASNMDRHKDTKKFIFVDKWMCDCSLEDLNREISISLRA